MPEFGTSGLRGLATDLTDELCATYAAAFVALHKNNGRLFVGQDNRESSPRISTAVAKGAASEGIEVVDCGVLPTPALARAALNEGTVSIMVTGSHIPADRNGLKFYTSFGEFTKADEGPLAEAVTSRSAPVLHDPKIIDGSYAEKDYIQRYQDGFPPAALRGLRIGVWVHSSAAAHALPAILDALGAHVVTLGASESFVSVDTEAVDADTRARLAGWVKDHALDAIVSTDGDADRPLMVDNLGRVLPGDILGPITARWCGATHVVTTVSANTLVDLLNAFQHVSRTKIGSPYVIAEMEHLAENASAKIVGYEPNGGFLLGWDMPKLPRLMTRDATLPIVATLAAAAETGKSLSDMLSAFPERRTATDRLKDIPREKSLALVEAILSGDHSVFPNDLGAVVSIDTTDGARLSFETEKIVHIRPSGNAPELRCYVEASGAQDAADVLQSVLEKLRISVT